MDLIAGAISGAPLSTPEAIYSSVIDMSGAYICYSAIWLHEGTTRNKWIAVLELPTIDRHDTLREQSHAGYLLLSSVSLLTVPIVAWPYFRLWYYSGHSLYRGPISLVTRATVVVLATRRSLKRGTDHTHRKRPKHAASALKWLHSLYRDGYLMALIGRLSRQRCGLTYKE